MAQASSSVEDFQRWLRRSRVITVLTGAGVSAESGVPTFRGAGGLWRRYAAQQLATPESWAEDPGRLWEFYNYRRELVQRCHPNPAHHALAELERRWEAASGEVRLLTQNIDGLHERAGSQRVTRLHGSLWRVRSVETGEVYENHDVPITPAYEGSGSPDPDAPARRFTEDDLPRGPHGDILRPHVVWFGEQLDEDDLTAAAEAVAACATFLVIGTAAVVWPAAGFVQMARQRGVVVAEINLEATPATGHCDFVFQGKAGELLPRLLDVSPEIHG